jgi:hypothetical protein
MTGELIPVGQPLWLPSSRKSYRQRENLGMRFLRLKLLLVIIFMASYHFDWKAGMHWTVIIFLIIGLFEFLLLR